MLVNVNIPVEESVDELKGVKVCKLGVKEYKNNFEERKDPHGKAYYWLAGELIEHEIEKDTDIYAVRNGYVSITPINMDLTGYEEMNRIMLWDIKPGRRKE
jgi:5'-nucleotidase